MPDARPITPATDRPAVDFGPGPGPDADGIVARIGPLSGRNRVAAAFYDGPGWRRFRPFERGFLALQGGARRARRQILHFLDPIDPGGRILEVGIGDGDNLPFLPPGRDVYGVDIARNTLAACARNHPAMHGRLAHAEGEDLPFADGTFDACYSVGGFNYYGDHGRSLAEMARVTRPGGLLVVADESPRLTRWGIGHLIGRPKLDGVWMRALGLDADFAAMVLSYADDPEAAVRLAWPGATRHAIWSGLGYCYAATWPRLPEGTHTDDTPEGSP